MSLLTLRVKTRFNADAGCLHALLVQAVFVSRALRGLSIGSPAVLFSEPEDRWDAVGELFNACFETAVAESNQERVSA